MWLCEEERWREGASVYPWDISYGSYLKVTVSILIYHILVTAPSTILNFYAYYYFFGVLNSLKMLMNSRVLSRLVSIIPRDFYHFLKRGYFRFPAINLPKKCEEEIEWQQRWHWCKPLERLSQGALWWACLTVDRGEGCLGIGRKKMLLEVPGKGLRVNGLEINHLLAEWFHRY